MLEAKNRYGAEIQRSQGVPVMIRVGLDSGDVVVRAIGSDLRLDYTAVGQATHLAARMEQMARPGSVLMTADTWRLVEGYVEVNALGPVTVKGLRLPIEVYEVTGAGPVRTRLQASAARGLTGFVRAYCRVDSRDDIRTVREQVAASMYREMGMTHWLEKVQREITELENDV